MRLRTIVIVVAAGLAASVAIYLLTAPKAMSPEARIRAALHRAAVAAEHKDVGGVLDVVGKHFSGRGLDRQTLRAYLFGAIRNAGWQKVLLTGTDVQLTSKSTAEVDTLAVLARGSGIVPKNAGRYRLSLGMDLEDGHWKVVRANWVHVSGSGLGIP